MDSMPTAYEGATPSLADDPALGLSQRAKLEVLFAVMLGLFLGALDQTIVGPALPTIVTQLSGNDYYVWAVTIYLLTSTITVPFWGKGSDLYGRKRVFIFAVGLFTVGSMLSGAAGTMEQLLVFRAIQGMGAGGIGALSMAIAVVRPRSSSTFPPLMSTPRLAAEPIAATSVTGVATARAHGARATSSEAARTRAPAASAPRSTGTIAARTATARTAGL